MTIKTNNVPNQKQTPINIRYTPTKERVKSKLPKHYTATDRALKKQGGAGIDNVMLCMALGITPERLKKILTGSELTIGEAAMYAKHFNVAVTDLYTIVKN